MCHVLVVETRGGLVLVDTGIGTGDLADPQRRLGRGFVTLTAPKLLRDETALAHVERLGFQASDVRHIVPTHLDVDHAGGLSDFPAAEVHVLDREHRAAMGASSFRHKFRYRAPQWEHRPRWQLHRVDGERWFGFDAVRAVPGSDDEVLLIPLHGHTAGHCGVAVRTPGGWLLHAGDAYFFHGEMDLARPRCTAALSLFQRVAAVDNALRLANQARLRELKRGHGGEVTIFSAHSPVELKALQGQAIWPLVMGTYAAEKQM